MERTAFALVILCTLAGCAPAARPPFPLPGWLSAGSAGPLRLEQRLRRDGEALEVCRSLENIGDRTVLVAPLTPDGTAGGQMLTFFLDGSGQPLPKPGGHGLFIPPPDLQRPDELTAIPPRAAFAHCTTLSLRGVSGEVFVVSSYRPFPVPEAVAVRVAPEALPFPPSSGKGLVSRACRVPKRSGAPSCAAPR